MLTKTQIDKLGYQLRDGSIDADVIRKLEVVRGEYFGAYSYVEDILANKLNYRLTGRPAKSTLAIIEKLRRESSRLSQVQDIAGCRIVAENVRVQDDICETIKVMLSDVTVVDRREKPTNGYRAVHLIARHKGWPVEIQVRSQLQHAWAEISEKISDAYGQEIKYGKGEVWAIEFLDRLSLLSEKLEEADTRIVDFKRNKEILLDESQRMGRSPRKVLEDAGLKRRLAFYRVRAHFDGLRGR